MQNPRDWIQGDETAVDFLSRVLAERPSLLIPPLHRVPLRVGNVVEIVGPSPSAKSEILLQAAINCILPKEWKGVFYGGLERIVMYFDLDCRFDVLRLSNVLKLRLMEACALTHTTYWVPCDDTKKDDVMAAQSVSPVDDELFLTCMRRFLYIRCYNSFEFLSALKTMHSLIQKESEALGVNAHFLIIDSIGAFHWIDRACHPTPHCDNKRKTHTLQICMETVVQEIRSLLQVQPMLVLATKATIFGSGSSIHGGLRAPGKWYSEDKNFRMSTKEGEQLMYRDYMPSAWQSLVTHRIHVGLSDESQGRCPTYTSEWVQPSLNILDKFTIQDGDFLCFMLSSTSGLVHGSNGATMKEMLNYLFFLTSIYVNIDLRDLQFLLKHAWASNEHHA